MVLDKQDGSSDEEGGRLMRLLGRLVLGSIVGVSDAPRLHSACPEGLPCLCSIP